MSLTNHYSLTCHARVISVYVVFSLCNSCFLLPVCLSSCVCDQPADGAGTVRHHHPGQQLAQARARPCLQDRHLWLEETLPLPVCAAAHRHPGGQLRPHHLDPQGDVVQHGTHDSPWQFVFPAGRVSTPSFPAVLPNVLFFICYWCHFQILYIIITLPQWSCLLLLIL